MSEACGCFITRTRTRVFSLWTPAACAVATLTDSIRQNVTSHSFTTFRRKNHVQNHVRPSCSRDRRTGSMTTGVLHACLSLCSDRSWVAWIQSDCIDLTGAWVIRKYSYIADVAIIEGTTHVANRANGMNSVVNMVQSAERWKHENCDMLTWLDTSSCNTDTYVLRQCDCCCCCNMIVLYLLIESIYYTIIIIPVFLLVWVGLL